MTSIERRHASRDQLVLIVDDDPDIREMWSDCLTRRGFRTHQAQDGIQAVELAERLSPAVILMDGQMPLLDGYGATECLKNSPATRSIPIVLMTAASNGQSQTFARRAGCDAFLKKPCSPTELLTTVRAMLHS